MEVCSIIRQQLEKISAKLVPDVDKVVRRRARGSVEPHHASSYIFSITLKLCQAEGIRVSLAVKIGVRVAQQVSRKCEKSSKDPLSQEQLHELIQSALVHLCHLLNSPESPGYSELCRNLLGQSDLVEQSNYVHLQCHSIINLRQNQEDRVVVIPDLRELLPLAVSQSPSLKTTCRTPDESWQSTNLRAYDTPPSHPITLLALFDGHRGQDAAEHCSHIVGPLLTRELVRHSWNAPLALSECVYRMNQSLHQCHNKFRWLAGTTATLCLMKEGVVYTAWVGDSQAWLLLRNGNCVALTDKLHRPDSAVEQLTVNVYGGTVTTSGSSTGTDGGGRSSNGCVRVSGMLGVSRALGDDRTIRGVSALPSLTAFRLFKDTREDEEPLCLVVASDGLWDAEDCHGEAVCEEIWRACSNTYPLTPAAIDTVGIPQRLCQQASENHSSDNVTVGCAWFLSHHESNLSSCVDCEDTHLVFWPAKRHFTPPPAWRCLLTNDNNSVSSVQRSSHNDANGTDSPAQDLAWLGVVEPRRRPLPNAPQSRRRARSVLTRRQGVAAKRISSPMRIVVPE